MGAHGVTEFSKTKKNLKVLSYQKKTHPSFGMTTTQDIRDLFAYKHNPLVHVDEVLSLTFAVYDLDRLYFIMSFVVL